MRGPDGAHRSQAVGLARTRGGATHVHADDGPKRLDVITDIEDAAKFVRANWGDGGKEPKVGVMGWSYGGYMTLNALVNAPDLSSPT